MTISSALPQGAHTTYGYQLNVATPSDTFHLIMLNANSLSSSVFLILQHSLIQTYSTTTIIHKIYSLSYFNSSRCG